jgi:uncharacterized membrane protein YedE/YeeE
MMAAMIGLLVGLLFGAGLALSGMTDTQKVIGFLDLLGDWDITLVFVMGGGLMVTVPVYQLYKNKSRPLFDTQFHLPGTSLIDKRLIGGAVLFGIGWGLFGYCPGPAISSIAYGHETTLYFVVSMIVGMAAANVVSTKSQA